MNRLRRLCAVAIITAALAVSAFAGTIDSPGVAAPQPPPSQTASTSTSITTTVILTILNNCLPSLLEWFRSPPVNSSVGRLRAACQCLIIKRKAIVKFMSQAKHEDFRVGKFVSLWLGNLGSEEEMDDYLSLGEQFENDFGFEIYSPDAPEYDVSEEGPKPIHELLEGFSGWETFIEAATTEAHAKGWTEATTALVFYNFKYDPKFVNPASSGLLTFIGVIPYGGFS